MEEIDWRKIKKIFFVGIKGVGMMPLALITKESGFEIAGSDIAEEFITDEVLEKKNIKVYENFREEDIRDFFGDLEKDSCLVITTGAHSGYDNPQVKWAKDLGIKYLNQGKALGIFMSGIPFEKELNGITVTGSHGKTTISAMIASSLSLLDFDPSYAVGTSEIFPIGPSGHFGKGKYFIAEGDEYVGEPIYDKTPKILYQEPEIAIINNIDFDHPDIYSDINDVKKVMTEFVNRIKRNGKVIINIDDNNLSEIRNNFRSDLEVITYGASDGDYLISNIVENVGNVSFKVENKGKAEDYRLNIPGIHNAKNALAVIALLDLFGVSDEKKKGVILRYKGCKRRMEMVGTTNGGAEVLDDYGHHPVEIESTLEAVRKFYDKKIVCVFQSHTYSRTKKLLKEFANSFKSVDELILIPIFKSQRDTEMDVVTHEDFTKAFEGNVNNLYSAKSLNDAVHYLRDKGYDNEYLIVTIGAGDVYKIGYKLVNK